MCVGVKSPGCEEAFEKRWCALRCAFLLAIAVSPAQWMMAHLRSARSIASPKTIKRLRVMTRLRQARSIPPSAVRGTGLVAAQRPGGGSHLPVIALLYLSRKWRSGRFVGVELLGKKAAESFFFFFFLNPDTSYKELSSGLTHSTTSAVFRVHVLYSRQALACDSYSSSTLSWARINNFIMWPPQVQLKHSNGVFEPEMIGSLPRLHRDLREILSGQLPGVTVCTVMRAFLCRRNPTSQPRRP